MNNYKMVKKAAAIALGATLITSSVGLGDVSAAATTYKIKDGKLVNAKTNKVISGYVKYDSKLYYKGLKFTGIYKTNYYKSGVKATGLYKNAYYVNGVKKVTTGLYQGAYYVNGVKKVTTGLYQGAYYVNGVKKVTTGLYQGAYYVKGVKKVTTGTYADAYYVSGVKKVTTGTYADAYYVKGVKKVTTGTYAGAYYVKGVNKVTTGLYNLELYTNGALNNGLKTYAGKLYNGSSFNKGLKEFENRFYNDENLAEGWIGDELYSKGLIVAASVSNIEANKDGDITVSFNKPVDETTVSAATLQVSEVGSAMALGTLSYMMSADKMSVTIKSKNELNGDYDVNVLDSIRTITGESMKANTKTISVEDTKAPTFKGLEIVDKDTLKFTFSEEVQGGQMIAALKRDGTPLTFTAAPSTNANELVFKIPNSLKAGDEFTLILSGVMDLAGNTADDIKNTLTRMDPDGQKPEMNNITAISSTKIQFGTSEEVTGLTIDDFYLDNKQLSESDGTLTNNGNDYLITLNTPHFNQQALRVEAGTFTDLAGETNNEISKMLDFGLDNIKPTVLSANLTSNKLEQTITEGSAKVDILGINGIFKVSLADTNKATKTGKTKYEVKFDAKNGKTYVTDGTNRYNTKVNGLNGLSATFTQDGVQITVNYAVAGRVFTVETVKGEVITHISSASLLMKFDENVNAVHTTYFVYSGNTLLDATATIQTTNNKDQVVATIDRYLTKEELSKGISLRSSDYKITDTTGNALDIGADGIQLTNE